MNLKEKLTSRKWLTAIAGIISGLAIVFGLDQGIISTVSGAVVSVISTIWYIRTEGKIDAARVAGAIEDIQDAVMLIGDGTE